MGWGAIQHNTLFSLQSQLAGWTRLQEKIASGMQLIRASDGPGDAYRVLNLQVERQTLLTYKSNLDSTRYNMEQIGSTLQEISTSLTRVRSLAAQAANGTYSPENRQAAGNEVDSILENILSLANTRSMGRQIFGGASLDTTPFEADRSDGRIIGVRYVGSPERLLVPVSQGVEYPSTAVGGEVFRSRGTGRPVFPAGLTGAAPGAGTPSARGDLVLRLAHTTTAYDDPAGTGIVAGAQSDSGDTILGSHRLTIEVNGATRTIQLDNGPKVVFASETNLRLANESGDVAYVDVSGFTGVAGVVSLEAGGTASIDGGATTTPLDFTRNNLAVADGRGAVLYVDATHIARAGAEPVRVTGSYDVFGSLIALRDLMLNTDGLSTTRQSQLIGDRLDSLDAALAGIAQHLTNSGARVQAMESLSITLENLEFHAGKQQSQLQDADIVSLATQLQTTQTYYQMTLQTASKMLSLSLLDFI